MFHGASFRGSRKTEKRYSALPELIPKAQHLVFFFLYSFYLGSTQLWNLLSPHLFPPLIPIGLHFTHIRISFNSAPKVLSFWTLKSFCLMVQLFKASGSSFYSQSLFPKFNPVPFPWWGLNKHLIKWIPFVTELSKDPCLGSSLA